MQTHTQPGAPEPSATAGSGPGFTSSRSPEGQPRRAWSGPRQHPHKIRCGSGSHLIEPGAHYWHLHQGGAIAVLCDRHASEIRAAEEKAADG